MLKNLVIYFVIASLPLFTGVLYAESPTPVGLWQSHDLQGIPRSIVKFSVINNQLQGRIVKLLLTKGQKPSDVCTQCPEPWRNKPKQGMVIIWGLKNKEGVWHSGKVLDTDSGKIYNCQVSVSPDNRTLYLHAYIGVQVLGKTVNWKRVK